MFMYEQTSGKNYTYVFTPKVIDCEVKKQVKFYEHISPVLSYLITII